MYFFQESSLSFIVVRGPLSFVHMLPCSLMSILSSIIDYTLSFVLYLICRHFTVFARLQFLFSYDAFLFLKMHTLTQDH